MAALSFRLTFGNLAFLSDRAEIVALQGDNLPDRLRNPVDMLEELDRLLPSMYREDFTTYKTPRNLDKLALTDLEENPSYDLRVGDWYYPTGVRRWSVFRGLASSTQVEGMTSQTEAFFFLNQSGNQVSGGYSGGTYFSGTSEARPGWVSGSVPFSGAMNYAPYIPHQGTGQIQSLFTMECEPAGAKMGLTYAPSRVQTFLSMLPPRPLAEVFGGVQGLDGIYLVTLVDERYYMQNSPVLLQVKTGMTWAYLLDQLALALGITLTTASPIEEVYGLPEMDSQLWASWESATVLLEAIANNVGRTIVRNYNGTYSLYTPEESWQITSANRGMPHPAFRVSGKTVSFPLTRVAGGNLFFPYTENLYRSGSQQLPVGDLRNNRNSVIPNKIQVTFPKYITQDDPVPHLVNTRIQNQRRSTLFEDNFDSFSVSVPIESGGQHVSGLTGISTIYLHDTAKALLSGEVAINSGIPLNNSGLVALSVRLAKDYYNNQVLGSIDETYPGIYPWTPEGLHDVIFTYSDKSQGAFTRVLHAPWTKQITEFQHATPPYSGFASTPPGVGGRSVAQTIRDSFGRSGTFIGLSGVAVAGGGSETYYLSGTITTTLASKLESGSTEAYFLDQDYFPTQNRWWGRVLPRKDSQGDLITSGECTEIFLFEGTSGGIYSSEQGGYRVNIVNRGVQGTKQQEHNSGSILQQYAPNTAYGVNLTTYEPGQFVFPSEWTSGGVQGINILPQTQTVEILDGEGRVVGGIRHFSGRVNIYDSTQVAETSGPWQRTDYIWVTERASGLTTEVSGVKAAGQLVGFYKLDSDENTSKTAPVYAVDITSPDTPIKLVQLCKKSYTDGCIVYRAFELTGEEDSCAYLVGKFLCDNIYTDNAMDLPTFPAPSPSRSLPHLGSTEAVSQGSVWLNYLNGVLDEDTSYASSLMTPNQETNYLLGKQYCFVLPEVVNGQTVVISEVEVKVIAFASGTQVPDLEVKLVVDSFIVGTSMATGSDLPTTPMDRVYIGSPASWGVPDLTPAQVNSNSFGIALRYKNNSLEARTVFVDAIEVTVRFSPSGGGAAHSTVRIKKTKEGTWKLDQMPWVDLFRLTGVVDDDGAQAYNRVRNDAGIWIDGEEVRVILAE